MIVSLPWMQWFTVPAPRLAAGPSTCSIPVAPYCYWIRLAGEVIQSQTSACGASYSTA